ncbi:hypothetical protein EZS27_035458 [termite gut metagenome]|uniref:Uncharacterized protein n=1 Tax=termite gut metagenome TaxID=433724 RepID=A0A5J4PXP8_9ZZZZ
MKSYTENKSRAICKKIIEVLERSEMDIDNTISINETDLTDVLEELRISNLDFNRVAKLKKAVSFEGYKIVYKDTKVLKVEKEEEMTLGEIPLKYC